MVTSKKKFKILAVIPARGGSKGIKKKNIRLLRGKPLLAYTIEAVRKSRMVTAFVTSTDNAAIANVARRYGSPVLQRPNFLAQDDTPMVPVLRHALQELEVKVPFDYVLVLQPTCPLRTARHIDEALKLIIKNKADSLISVYQVADHHPARMYSIKNNRLVPLMKGAAFQVRQKLAPVYHRNGALYVVKRDVLVKQGTLFGKKCCPYVMPRELSVNIDEESDWYLAEALVKKWKK